MGAQKFWHVSLKWKSREIYYYLVNYTFKCHTSCNLLGWLFWHHFHIELGVSERFLCDKVAVWAKRTQSLSLCKKYFASCHNFEAQFIIKPNSHSFQWITFQNCDILQSILFLASKTRRFAWKSSFGLVLTMEIMRLITVRNNYRIFLNSTPSGNKLVPLPTNSFLPIKSFWMEQMDQILYTFV
jgi:hypothetical protein